MDSIFQVSCQVDHTGSSDANKTLIFLQSNLGNLGGTASTAGGT